MLNRPVGTFHPGDRVQFSYIPLNPATGIISDAGSMIDILEIEFVEILIYDPEISRVERNCDEISLIARKQARRR